MEKKKNKEWNNNRVYKIRWKNKKKHILNNNILGSIFLLI